jgi:16S rRNA (uracil1498-N3)-methyltransferase
LVDDADQYLNYKFFFDSITGELIVNPKNNQSYEIPFDKAPKFVFTSNHAQRNLDPSLEARLLYTVFSDYYHQQSDSNDYSETRSIRDDFGKDLYAFDYSESEWNADFNFFAQCIRFYLSVPSPLKINPPMENVTLRNMLAEMGQAFKDWADAYFDQEGSNINRMITLAQALPKGGTMDAIVRKATEMGAARIIPLESERTQVHLDTDRSNRKIDKWQTAALEAAKQCGNAFVPEVLPIQPATAFMATAHGYDLKLIASLQPGARSLKATLAVFAAANGRAPKKVLWLIGPEGDFTPAEMSGSQTYGFAPITLGPLVLRCETAAIYALSVLSYELQNP